MPKSLQDRQRSAERTDGSARALRDCLKPVLVLLVDESDSPDGRDTVNREDDASGCGSRHRQKLGHAPLSEQTTETIVAVRIRE